ncbi:MAG TPA: 3-methyladenine DNA glycosylase 2 [Thiopseudomonas sp.]|nr:3-methyladenine DNA glycosylase 2 [Thiopseudomonas sp.]
MTLLTHSIALPSDYQTAAFLSFHQRDSQQFAERVSDDTLEKGLLWYGQPAVLKIQFTADQAHGQLQLDGQTNSRLDNEKHWQQWLEYFTGVQQPIAEFIAQHQQHPELGPLLRQQPGLRVAQTSSPFEAISWAIIGQQISVAAALNIRRRFIELSGIQHSSGLYCYPDAHTVAQLTIEQLRSAGLSQNKARAIATLSKQLSSNQLHFPEQVTADTIKQLRSELLGISGVGPWTVNYTLMRGFAWLDGSLHGDAAVRRYLQVLLNKESLSAKQAEQWLQQFSPWRALVAAHLWQSQGFAG